MAETDSNTIWLTQEAYDKLQSELEYLTGEGRAEITARIAAAREEGDLKENGGYHAAREEQGKQEARIVQVQSLLRHAEVGDAPASSDVAVPGTKVTIAFEGDPEDTDTFLLGSREVLGLDEAADEVNVYSPQSPLGAAILDKRVGDTVSYETPNGRSISVQIIEVAPFPS